MRTWSKRWAILAGSLLGALELLAPAHAQFPPGMPEMPTPPAHPGAGPPGAGPPGAAKESPFSLRSEGPNAFCDDDGCLPPPQPYILTLRGEYLHWYVSPGNLSQPLITTSTNPNLANDRGAFGQVSTSDVLGAGEYTYGALPGGRVTFGIAPDRLIPIEITGFWLGRTRDLFGFQSDGTLGTAVVARPIQLADIPQQLGLPLEDVSLVNFPGVVAGQMTISSTLSMWGIEPSIFFPCCATDCLGIAAFAGYRYVDMSESLDILTVTAPVGGVALNFAGDPAGFGTPNFIGVADRYRVTNQFNGGQIGVRADLSAWRLTFATDLKLAIGSTYSSWTSEGISQLFAVAGTVALPGGVLVQPSNAIGQNQSAFSVIPEANFNLRFRLHDNISIYGGYNIFYWTSVLRAGDNIRRTLNSQEIPTDINFNPAFVGNPTPPIIQSTGFFAHGINFGIEIGF